MAENEINEEEVKTTADKESVGEEKQEEKAFLDSKIDSLQDKMNNMDLAQRKKVFVLSCVGVCLFIVIKLVIGVMWNSSQVEEPVKKTPTPVVTDSTDIILNELLSDEEVLKDPAVDSALNIIMKK